MVLTAITAIPSLPPPPHPANCLVLYKMPTPSQLEPPVFPMKLPPWGPDLPAKANRKRDRLGRP
eukprot:767878-Hanusia_phi.AAC.11